jgi:hypothetical protein
LRRRITILLLFPIIVLLWIVGWSLYSIGDNQKNRKPLATKELDIQINPDLAIKQTNP